jgi:predicted flavoprotein YhiN
MPSKMNLLLRTCFIQASGGSRCNILPNPDRPLNVDDDFYFPPATKKGAIRALLGSWNLDGCRVWLEDDIGIPLKLEEDADKLFPQSDSGVEVRDKLLAAVARHPNVHVETGAELMGIEIDEGSSSSGRLFRCRLADGREQAHARVVLATGGKSFASLGTTGTGYEILRGLGVAVNAPEPALTPLLFAKKENELVNLAGVTLQHAMMTVSYTGDDGFTPSKASPSVSPQNNDETKGGKKKKRAKPKVRQAVRGQSLITHRGVSGPDAMDLRCVLDDDGGHDDDYNNWTVSESRRHALVDNLATLALCPPSATTSSHRHSLQPR